MSMKMSNPAIKRQQIVTWYTLEEKLPPYGEDVIVTFSRKGYDHCLGIGTYWPEEHCWIIERFSLADSEGMTVHAWCELDPYEEA